jgi:hypothetical protein
MSTAKSHLGTELAARARWYGYAAFNLRKERIYEQNIPTYVQQANGK